MEKKECIFILKKENKKLLEEYKKSGVWALWAKAKGDSENFICLEVGQTNNMYKEINENIRIFTEKDSNECLNCDCTYNARRRNKEYSKEFKIHKCKNCSKKKGVRAKYTARRVDKYKNMLENYDKFEFILFDDLTNRKQFEKEYAKRYKALYWFS